MSSFPLPDHSSITSSPEKPRQNVEHSTLQFSPTTTSRGKESVGPEPELQAILEQAMEGTGASGAAIVLSTEDAVCCRASTGAPAPEVGTHLHAGTSLTGLCLLYRRNRALQRHEYRSAGEPPIIQQTGIRSVLILPIKQNAQVVGALEVLSINPNAFNQHDATAMTKLADRVLPLPSESATIPDRCLGQLPSKDIKALRNPQELLALAGHHIGSQLPDQPVTTTIQENPSRARWLTTGLATAALALAICGYGYYLNRPSVATNVATPPIAAANHKPAVPHQQHRSEQDNKTNGLPKASDTVLTATRQELILAIQEAVQGTDVNRILNRADAGAGDSIAQYEMALRYADGEGVPQNYRDAMAWFAKRRQTVITTRSGSSG